MRARTLPEAAWRAGRALLGTLAGRPLNPPAFGSQTLEADDAAWIAAWLDDAAPSDPADALAFEQAFAAWNGSAVACAFMGGREALTACLRALDLRPGDEVVVPAYTCVVVANAIRHEGLVVRFCDIELDTYGPAIDSLAAALTPRTRVVVTGHLYGLVSRDTARILALAAQHGLRVIEDCTHAMGAALDGRKVGNLGDLAFFSTEQSKSISTFRGGVAVANDPALGARLLAIHRATPLPTADEERANLANALLHYRLQKDPARWWRAALDRDGFRFPRLESTTAQEIDGELPPGYFRRMPGRLAALAGRQLARLDAYNATRRAAALRWDGIVAREGLAIPRVLEGSTPVFLRYPVLAPEGRKYDAAWARARFGVPVGHWFTGELHPMAKPMAHCQNARTAVERCINLPTLGVWP
jgi:dTDP-4-amino-4,6-dideoxygalactose transaminase